MSKSFIPFDKFERECLPDSKPLHETMQENCNDRLTPPVKPCPNPCVPYWQRTGNQRCLDIGVVEIEEADGCGHTRFTRVTDPVVWEDSTNTRCDEPRNRIERQQVNQCGGTRWVTTAELCCMPNWVSIDEIDCAQSMERVIEEDGCGNTRMRSTGFSVNWVGTGEVRCEPGDIYQIEQQNQCGDTRWFTVPGGCPCIPDWQPSGPERCTGADIERQEVDGCGHTRWESTGVAVIWSNTGETRCNGGFIQNEQMSQCGTTRWFTTDTACTNSPSANELGIKWFNADFGGGHWSRISAILDVASGTITYYQHGASETIEAWVTGGFARGDYEARLTWTADEAEGPFRVRSGSTLNTWFNLGDISVLSITLSCEEDGVGAFANDTLWHNNLIRFDIRKVGESISGGLTLGPFLIRAD